MNDTIAAFGEIMLRLSSPTGDLGNTDVYDGCFGGTEANVLAVLSRFGEKTSYLTALPDNGLGAGVIKHLASFGVDCSRAKVGGERLGVYFTELGSGSRGANVIYYRSDSEFSRLTPDAFDFDSALFGVKLFHISGISFALSSGSRELTFKFVDEAKKRGIPVSFDFNYRQKLWSVDAARPVLAAAAKKADILFASSLDFSAFLQADEESFFNSSNCSALVVRDRRVISESRHVVSVRLYMRGADNKTQKAALDDFEFDVKERIGGGDAFDGAMLFELLKANADVKRAVGFATAAFALKHTVKGDMFTLGEEDVIEYAKKSGIDL